MAEACTAIFLKKQDERYRQIKKRAIAAEKSVASGTDKNPDE